MPVVVRYDRSMDLKHKHWAVIFIGILVALLAAIAAWYAFGSNTAKAPSETATSSPAVATTTAQAPEAHITEHATYYDIDLSYPSATLLVSVSADANDRAVATMKGALQDTANQFKTDGNFSHLTHDDIQMMGLDQRKEALGAEYKTYTGVRTVSYVFEIYEDTLGAHPNAFYRTFTFDTRTGAELKLSDLFAPGTNYLGTLSTIASQQLPAIVAAREQVSVSEVDTDYLHSGISPEPSAFQSWYISGNKLTIVFPPYQVGPYALGTIELPIPLSQLASLKAEYK